MSGVTVQELKLETAEPLPSRETLHCRRAQAPAAQREGSAQRAGRPPALRGRPPIPSPRGYVREEQADDPGSRAPGRRQPNQPASGPGARVFRTQLADAIGLAGLGTPWATQGAFNGW